MSIAAALSEDRVLVSGVSWPTFKALVAEARRGGTRFTYDRGWLELMSPSPEHEHVKTLMGRMIEAMTLELGIPIRSAGSTTLLSEMSQRRVEPDECYYVANELRVRVKKDLDLSVDPPPDLAIEVDISASSIGQLPIYASLGVPEVWLESGDALRVFVLQSDGTYARQPQSAAFPFLPLDEFQRFLDRRDELDETRLIGECVAWVRRLGRDR